jgi:mannose-6-phosphate isomerase
MTALAPFRLAPYFRTRIWGFNDLKPWYDFQTTGEPIGEVWLTGDMCPAETGPCTGKSLSQITADHGEAVLGPGHAREEFPLLVKILFPKEKLSVQVHPDDTLAQQYGEPRGKTECWYALDAGPDSSVALGIKPGTTVEQVRTGIDDGTLENLLEWLPVHKGDMIFVDAGTVHAIGPGAVLLETQQTSDLTYRMYDYGRGRELHLDKSFAAMRLTTDAGLVKPIAENGRTVLLDKKYFRVERLTLSGTNVAAQFAPPDAPPGVQMFFVISGTARLQPGSDSADDAGFDPFTVAPHQLAVIPANPGPWQIDATGPLELIRILPH